MEKNCIFCKIIAGEIPADKIYENDKVIAFLDVSPVNPGHTLVTSKQHFENMQATPDSVLCDLISAVKKVSKAVIKVTGADSFNLDLNNGKTAGQIVPHIHFHIIPRFAEDGYAHWKGKIKYSDGESKQIAEAIKKKIK